MNNLIVTGRVGSDATISSVGNTNVINFSLCHSEKYKNAAGVVVEKTQWFSVSYYTEKTGIAAYIKKGGQLAVIGSVDCRMYDDKNGVKVAQLVVKASRIELLGSAPTAQQQVAEPVENTSKFNNDVASIYAGESEPLEPLPF